MASDGAEIARGIYHPAKSSAAYPAVLRADGDVLRVTVEGQPSPAVSAALAMVIVSDRIGRIPRRISFSDGALFETEDNAAIDLLLTAHRANRTGWIHELERIHPRLLALVAGVFLLGFLIYRFALPALVEVAIWVTPPVVPHMMSKGTLSSLDQTVLSPSKLPAARQAEIRKGFDEIAAFSTRGQATYHLNFRNGGVIGPNAFALPDGSLVLTDALVDMAGNDTEMVLGVLAHEIGHVEKNHSLLQLYRAAGTAGLIMLIAGDIGSGGEELLTDGAALLSLSYSRAAEAEADQVSVTLMAKAGHDPAAIGRFFKLLEDRLGDHGDTSMLSTHPGTPERRAHIEELARKLREGNVD